MHRAREISSILLRMFELNEVTKIFVIYTDMKNSLEAQAISTRLVPFHRQQFRPNPSEAKVKIPFEFSPSIGVVLDNDSDGLCQSECRKDSEQSLAPVQPGQTGCDHAGDY